RDQRDDAAERTCERGQRVSLQAPPRSRPKEGRLSHGPWVFALAFLAGGAGIVAPRALHAWRDRAWGRRLPELRALAAPAEGRLARGAEADELRARLAELDRQLQQLAPESDAPPVHALSEATLALDPAPYRAWVKRAKPALDRWLDAKPVAPDDAAASVASQPL